MGKDTSTDNFQFVGHEDPPNVPCLGKAYDPKSDVCQGCRSPVIAGGKVVLLKEVCRSLCQDKAIAQVRRLSSSDIKTLLVKKATVQEIFNLMVDDPTEVQGKEARRILMQRLRYISKNHDYPTPDIPDLQDLMENYT